jgi:hypothetical protein
MKMSETEEKAKTPYEIHNRDAGRIVAEIVCPTLDAGGDTKDVLILLESVVTGVLSVVVKIGGDNEVLDVFIAGVRQRMAEIRLGNATASGNG